MRYTLLYADFDSCIEIIQQKNRNGGYLLV